jgi:tRNA A37 threonylcarbamoyladenosine modification protein TsaB
VTTTLAIETSSVNYGVAVGVDGDVVAERTLRRDDPAFTGLADLVASIVDDFGRVDRVAVDVGPGNLASVRSGVAYANGLAFSLGKPILVASSLELLALEAGDGPTLCLRDAGSGRVYAWFDGVRRHGPFEPVVLSLVGEHTAIAVAGVHRAKVAALLPGVAVKDTGIDAPQVTTLLAAGLQPVEVASPLTEASPEFAG